MWDIIACWPSARVGEVVTISCPTYFSYFSDQQKGKYFHLSSVHLSAVRRKCVWNVLLTCKWTFKVTKLSPTSAEDVDVYSKTLQNAKGKPLIASYAIRTKWMLIHEPHEKQPRRHCYLLSRVIHEISQLWPFVHRHRPVTDGKSSLLRRENSVDPFVVH